MGESLVVRVTERFVAALRAIGSESDAVKWLTQPRRVAAGFYPSDLASARPALYVEAFELSNELQAGGLHRASLGMRVYCVGGGGEDPHTECWRLARDAAKAIAAIDTGDPMVGELILVEGPEATLQLPDSREGAGAVVLTYRASYDWGHADP